MTEPVVPVLVPAGFAPLIAVAYADGDVHAVRVDAGHPLPVAPRIVAGSAAPLTGSTAASIVAGPFEPELGRAVQLRLTGTWTGSVKVRDSVDGGATKLALSVAGQPWAVFTANVNEEEIRTPRVAGTTFWLDVTIASGTLGYWMGQ